MEPYVGWSGWPVCHCADHSGPQRTPEPELFPLFVSGPMPRGDRHGSARTGLDMGRLGYICRYGFYVRFRSFRMPSLFASAHSTSPSMCGIRLRPRSVGEGRPDLAWVRQNTVLIHYCGRNKPWKPRYIGELGVFYDEFLRELGELPFPPVA